MLMERLEDKPYTGNNGFYSYTKPSSESIKHMRMVLKGWIDNPDEELHATIMYSSNTLEVKVANDMVSRGIIIPAHGNMLDYFTGHDQAGYIVLRLNSAELNNLHNKWKSAGLEPKTFKFYKPHITLSKDVGPKNSYLELRLEEINKKLILNPLFIQCDGEHIQDIKV